MWWTFCKIKYRDFRGRLYLSMTQYPSTVR